VSVSLQEKVIPGDGRWFGSWSLAERQRQLVVVRTHFSGPAGEVFVEKRFSATSPP
jgi:hypothetical protein